jgi:hypothetical protein
MDFAKKSKRKEWVKNKNMKAFTFVNPHWAISEIDIMIDTPLDYEKAKDNLKYIKIHNTKVPLISIKDLIRMKRVSKREQDKSDCLYLRKIINEK